MSAAQTQERELHEVPPDGDTPEDGDGGGGQPPPTPEAKEEGELFDKAAYESEALRLPKVDGEGVDKIKAKFGGTVWLERGNENDVALIRDLKLGQEVQLLVTAKVGPPVPGWTTSLEGDLDTISLGRTFTVESVSRGAGEGL